jgi:hypothetical protein
MKSWRFGSVTSLLPLSVLALSAACAAGTESASHSASRVSTGGDGGAPSASSCPDTSLGETPQDCPWAAVARDMIAAAAQGRDEIAVLASEAPAIAAEIAADQPNTDLLDLWGVAINLNQATTDTYGNEPIVDPSIEDILNADMGVAPRQNNLTHAGVQHTYGYLFSLLQTPYGYKRARWVAPDVTQGFGMPDGTFGPTPPDGTLFGNVTYMAGSIAFTGEPELATVQGNTSEVGQAVQRFDLSSLQVSRLTEVATLADGRTITLRTDFVPFPAIDVSSAPASANTYWLVYSVNDSGDGRSRLITAFPISTASMQSYSAASLLGDGMTISTQYNAWVDGLSGSTATGTRTLASLPLGG